MKKNLNNSLGNLVNFNKKANGIIGFTTHGNFEITFRNANTVKVHITANKEFDHFSYATIDDHNELEVEVTDQSEEIIVSSGSLLVHMAKEPVRFKFLNKNNEVINEDDPDFGTSWIGQRVTTYKKLQENEKFIGLGEKTGNLNRRGSAYTNWNTDHYKHPVDADPIYGSYPFYIGIHQQSTYGIFLDNSYQSVFNFGASNDRFAYFSADDGDMVYYFIHFPKVTDIIQEFSRLTGKMPLPPRWSIGFHQCRWSYYPEDQVISVAETFRRKNIPADSIYLDIDYMQGYKLFTFHDKRFPKPAEMISRLGQLGFKLVVIIDPGVKKEEEYSVYREGKSRDVFLKYPDGSYFTGQVWPGWCHFPDFSLPEAREWWKDQFRSFCDMNIAGFWNDMNEISTLGQCMPDLIEFNMDGHLSTTREGRNIYGLLMSRSTYEAAVTHSQRRPFILTRAGFCGVQRYSAVWTGDNIATDEHMLLGVRMVNSLGLVGVPFSGFDTGGFVGDATQELFARWISLGAFSPYFRIHSAHDTKISEPWSYSAAVEEISRNYISLRYRLLPYLYSIFAEASSNGIPICRSLAIDYFYDEKIYEIAYQNQYLFGPYFLIAACTSQDKFTKVYLPKGRWYSFFDDRIYDGEQEIIIEAPIHKLPVFIKAGAMIPVQSLVQSTSENHDGVLELHVYYGSENDTFELYEDDGESFDYKNEQYCKRKMTYLAGEQRIILSAAVGLYPSSFSKIKFVLHGFSAGLAINMDENPIELKQEQYTFFDFQAKNNTFEPQSEEFNFPLVVQTFVIDYVSSEIIIQW